MRASQIVDIFGFSKISEDKIIPHFENVIWFDISVNTATVVKSHQTLNTPVTDELELLLFFYKNQKKLITKPHQSMIVLPDPKWSISAFLFQVFR